RKSPHPPMKTTYAGSLFAKAAGSLGYKPFPAPTAANSRQYKNEYGATNNSCVYCGYCESFACEMGAKASPQTTVLPVLMQNKNFELRTLCKVVRVTHDTDKKSAVSVIEV